MKQYHVEAGHTQRQVEEGQCDVVDIYDTLTEAKRRARYLLTDEAQRAFEISEPLRYARITLNGELQHGCCISDFYRKGYHGE